MGRPPRRKSVPPGHVFYDVVCGKRTTGELAEQYRETSKGQLGRAFHSLVWFVPCGIFILRLSLQLLFLFYSGVVHGESVGDVKELGVWFSA